MTVKKSLMNDFFKITNEMYVLEKMFSRMSVDLRRNNGGMKKVKTCFNERFFLIQCENLFTKRLFLIT